MIALHPALPDRSGAHPGRRAQRMAGLRARHRAAHLFRQPWQPFRHRRRDGGVALAGAPAHPSGRRARLLGHEQISPLHRRDGAAGRADRPQAEARQRAAGAAGAPARRRPFDPDLSGGNARRGRRRDRRRFAAASFGWRSNFPDVELVPIYLDNLQRILPKGSMLLVPITCTARFGTPLHVKPGEDKAAFLERARTAVQVARRWRSDRRMNVTLLIVLGGIVALLTVASLVGYVLEHRAPRARHRSPPCKNLNARIRSWWVMVVVFGGALAARQHDDHRAVRHPVVHGAARILDAHAFAARRPPGAVPVVLRRPADPLRPARRRLVRHVRRSSSRSTPS